MSQRNPQNDRYIAERKERAAGSTRPKAGSAKPANKAAASVRVQTSPSKMSRRQKMMAEQSMSKEERKAKRAKEREQDNLTYAAQTALTNKDPRYKHLRHIWWVLLIVAVAFTLLSWLTLATGINQVVSIVILVLAYAGIISALVMDFTVIRKQRNKSRDRVKAMSQRQVQRIVAQENIERQANNEAKKARREAKYANKSKEEQEAAYQEAYAAAMAANSKVLDTAEALGADGADAMATDADGTDGEEVEDEAAAAEAARIAAAKRAAREYAASKGR